MMACSLLSYLDRQALAVLAPTILADTHLTAESYAQAVSCFSIAYMLGNPLWGSLLGRVGLRSGMIAAVALWSVASASHAWMSGFLGFALARTVLGLGEGATFPGGLRTAMDSLPPGKQARGLAISYSGGSLGAVLTPVLVVPLAGAFGWRSTFLLTGLLGALWIVSWAVVARPPLLPATSHRASAMVWPNPFERRFWALVSSYALCAAPLGPILYLAPLYLSRVHHVTQDELGRILWIPPLGWEIGYFFWGWLIDRHPATTTHAHTAFLSLAALSLPFAAIHFVPLVPVLVLLFLQAFLSAGFIVLSLRVAASHWPREQTALVAGIAAGSWSAFVAVLMPLLGRWFDAGGYELFFATTAILPLAGTAGWVLLHPKEAVRSA